MIHYLHLSRNSLMGSLTYRAHMIFQILASALAIVIQFFLWRSIYAATPGGMIKGMGFMDTFTYVSLAAAIMVLVRTWVDWGINGLIQSGDVITFLFKPVDFMTWTLFETIGLVAANLLTITIPTLLVLFGLLGAKVMIGWNILVFLVAVGISAFMSFLLDFAIGLTCFWTQSIWGISTTKEVVVLLLSGALIPLAFYPEGLRQVLDWLPFAWMYNFPLTVLNAHTPDWGYWLRGLGIQTFWLAALYLIVRGYYRIALRKLTVNGG